MTARRDVFNCWNKNKIRIYLRYDTIEEFNLDSKAEYGLLSFI